MSCIIYIVSTSAVELHVMTAVSEEVLSAGLRHVRTKCTKHHEGSASKQPWSQHVHPHQNNISPQMWTWNIRPDFLHLQTTNTSSNITSQAILWWSTCNWTEDGSGGNTSVWYMPEREGWQAKWRHRMDCLLQVCFVHGFTWAVHSSPPVMTRKPIAVTFA